MYPSAVDRRVVRATGADDCRATGVSREESEQVVVWDQAGGEGEGSGEGGQQGEGEGFTESAVDWRYGSSCPGVVTEWIVVVLQRVVEPYCGCRGRFWAAPGQAYTAIGQRGGAAGDTESNDTRAQDVTADTDVAGGTCASAVATSSAAWERTIVADGDG